MYFDKPLRILRHPYTVLPSGRSPCVKTGLTNVKMITRITKTCIVVNKGIKLLKAVTSSLSPLHWVRHPNGLPFVKLFLFGLCTLINGIGSLHFIFPWATWSISPMWLSHDLPLHNASMHPWPHSPSPLLPLSFLYFHTFFSCCWLPQIQIFFSYSFIFFGMVMIIVNI